MTKIRFYLLALLVWFFGFYNLEREIADINMASYVYVLVAAYSIFFIVFTPIHRYPILYTTLGALAVYLVLNAQMGHDATGLGLPIIFTEMSSIAITVFLSTRLGRRIEGLRREILNLSVGSSSVAAKPFATAQAECYREIRRARHYNRPAAILSIQPTDESVDVSLNRFILEAQQSIIHQYVVARTADLLRSALKETDVVTMRNDHFLVLLPETTQEHLPIILKRLQNAALEKLGLKLNVGVSTFPDDAITFESLVEYAEQRMGDTPASEDATRTDGSIPPAEAAHAELNNVDAAR